MFMVLLFGNCVLIGCEVTLELSNYNYGSSKVLRNSVAWYLEKLFRYSSYRHSSLRLPVLVGIIYIHLYSP